MILVLPAEEMEDLALISSWFAQFPFLLHHLCFYHCTLNTLGCQETNDSLEAFFSQVRTFAVVLGSVPWWLYVPWSLHGAVGSW